MIWSYLKNAIRNLSRYKSFSLINIMGLAVGLAASLIIALWVFDELSYDKFNKNFDHIYRIERHIHWDGKLLEVPVTGAVYAKTIKKDIPEVVDFTRIYRIELSVWNYLNSNQEENIMFCDTGFFHVFTFPLLRGDPKTVLKEPFSVVLSEDAAVKYFGVENPINKTLEVEWGDERKKFRVTGIMKNVPSQSHFHFDVVASFATLEELMPERLETWMSNYLYTYVLLHPDTKPEDIAPKLRRIVEEYISPAYQAFLGDKSSTENVHDIFQIRLRPIGDIHLNSGLMWEIEPQGNITTVYIFSIISILILVMACFNFMNLSTALSSKRSREIGIRKTAGASRYQLIVQLLSESIIIALIALVIALLIIDILLPGFNSFTGKALSLSTFLQLKYLLILLFIVLGSGILAGLYPAFYLSHFNPMVVLRKNEAERSNRFSFRQVLVVLQFSITILLIIGTVTAYLQINFFYNKPVGYNQNKLFVISTESNEVRNKLDAYKSILLQNPEIVSITSSGSIPAAKNFSDMGFKAENMEDVISSIYINVSYDFFKTYQIEFLAGRPYSREFGTDTLNKFIVNETLVKKIGISDPEKAIGLHYGNFDSEGNLQQGEIIGVVKDFHYKPMDEPIEPVTFILNEKWTEYITMRYNTTDLTGFVSQMENTWRENFPQDAYTYFFLKDRYESLYIDVTRLKNILLAFTFLAVFIGCLGLFGLAAFIAQQKSKEIGIRKIHGASVLSIMILLTKQFSNWVLLANLIAWPLAFYLLDRWLSNFYYHIGMPYWVFFASGLLALILAVVTVSYRAYRAASSDPLESIKYE